MTENQAKFLVIVKHYEKLKKELKVVSEGLDSALAALDKESYFQDPETLAVYHITVPSGTFVPFKTVTYERTALEGEAKGSLSKKEAQEKGFDLGR